MKRLLILFALFCSVLCHAQQQNVKIYLNNGRIVSGGLQEETSTTVTIVKPDGEPEKRHCRSTANNVRNGLVWIMEP